MSYEQQLNREMNYFARLSEATKKSLNILDEVAFKLHNEPDAWLILEELERNLQLLLKRREEGA